MQLRKGPDQRSSITVLLAWAKYGLPLVMADVKRGKFRKAWVNLSYRALSAWRLAKSFKSDKPARHKFMNSI